MVQRMSVAAAARAAGPRSSRRVMLGMRQAVLECFGRAGLERVAQHLPPETRAALIEQPALLDADVPSAYPEQWVAAVWNGPAQRDHALFERYVDREVDLGFTRFA